MRAAAAREPRNPMAAAIVHPRGLTTAVIHYTINGL
nr:MAG TPA: hypothetical protein [Bacteriophage sp.]